MFGEEACMQRLDMAEYICKEVYINLAKTLIPGTLCNIGKKQSKVLAESTHFRKLHVIHGMTSTFFRANVNPSMGWSHQYLLRKMLDKS